MSHDLGQGMQSGLLLRSSSEGPPFQSRLPPTSQQTPSDGLQGTQILTHWQAPAPMDQISVLQGQLNFVQKALTEEVHTHNQTRASRQYYRDATLQWERQYYAMQAQVRDQNAVTRSLQQRLQELEAIKLSGRRMAEPMVKPQSMSMLNNPMESTQAVAELPISDSRSTLTPSPLGLPSSLMPGKRKTRFASNEGIELKRTRKVPLVRPFTPKMVTMDQEGEERWASASEGNGNN